MKHVLVTGCAGFIGSNVTERLLSENYHVTGIDNFSRFYAREVKERNMAGFVQHPNFRFCEVDIRDEKALLQAVSTPFDVVVHLAAKAGVRPSINDPAAYIDVNIRGTSNVVALMREHHCDKLFFASSSSVYGNQKTIPFREDEVLDMPISPYAYTKRSAELLCHTNHHLYNIDVICARFFTVYGPRQRPDLAIHKFVRAISNDEPITMFGDGETSRDYTFVTDTVAGIMAGINYLNSNTNVFEIINLGNNRPVKLKELISLIAEKLGKSPIIERLPMQQGDVDITYADLRRAKALLGYQPKISIEAGIERFVEWFAQEQTASVK